MSWGPQRFAGNSRLGGGGLGAVAPGAALEGGVRYLVHDRLGSGGMAEVYLGTMATPAGRRPVAVKQVLEEKLRDPEAIDRLVAEAKLGFRLTHANICQVIDLIVNDRGAYLVLEYVDGFDLLRLMQERHTAGLDRLDLATCLFVSREVARGLDFAHRCTGEDGRPLRIVHGDITPPNVLLSKEGEVKLADFGIAHALSAGAPGENIVGGTAGFVAPEVESSDGDHRADIYALGATLQYALTGRVPSKHGDTSPLGERRDIPQSTRSLITRCLSVRPEERFSSAGELEAALSYELARRAPTFTPAVLAKMIVGVRRQTRARSELDLTKTLFSIDQRASDFAFSDESVVSAPALSAIRGSVAASSEAARPVTVTVLPRVAAPEPGEGRGTVTAHPTAPPDNENPITLTANHSVSDAHEEDPITLTAYDEERSRTLTSSTALPSGEENPVTLTAVPISRPRRDSAQRPISEETLTEVAATGAVIDAVPGAIPEDELSTGTVTAVPDEETFILPDLSEDIPTMLTGEILEARDERPVRIIAAPSVRSGTEVARTPGKNSSSRGVSLAAIAAAVATLVVGMFALFSWEPEPSTNHLEPEVQVEPAVVPAGAPERPAEAIDLEPLPERVATAPELDPPDLAAPEAVAAGVDPGVDPDLEAAEVAAGVAADVETEVDAEDESEDDVEAEDQGDDAEDDDEPRSDRSKKRSRPARKSARSSRRKQTAPPRESAPTEVAARTDERRGYLSVSARPWGAVEVDGERVARETPLFRHPLQAGRHRVVVIYSDGTRSRARYVDIEPGETHSVGFQQK